ncbi:MAG: hypothetical protein ACRBFS_11340 [Aureispira sp.]
MIYSCFTIKAFCVLLLLFLVPNVYGQNIQELETQIETEEQAIEALEKRIARNNTTGNGGNNAALNQEKEGHEREIKAILNKIKILESGGSLANTNDCELEITSCRKEIEATEAIVEKLEAENLNLNKEIQRLTMEGGGTVEIERLRKRAAEQKQEIQVLKGQIKGYQKRANATTSNPSGASTAQVSALERKIERLERDKVNLRQQLQKNKQPSRRTSNFGEEHHFQKQFVQQNATNVLFGYRYTLLPQLNFKETPVIYQGSERVGTLTSTPNQQVAGHQGYLGIERLWHGRHAGGNIGFAATYSYNSQADMIYHIVGGQLGAELTILPLRMGIRVSGTAGYVWGQLENHSLVLENGSINRNPRFSTMIWGLETKLRVYISRMVAFTGSIGVDYPISQQWEMEFWDTSLKFGFGLDILIPTTR